MRDFINIISESLRTTIPFSWTHYVAGDYETYKAVFQIDDGYFDVTFMEKYHSRNVWEFTFRRNGVLDLTGTGSAGLVLATVMEIAREFISVRDPRWITFAAKNDEPSRLRLYPKIMALMQREFPHYIFDGSKKLRTHTTYALSRPQRPMPEPEPVLPPEPAEPISDEEWAEIEAMLTR